jgi:hypothetical protein
MNHKYYAKGMSWNSITCIQGSLLVQFIQTHTSENKTQISSLLFTTKCQKYYHYHPFNDISSLSFSFKDSIPRLYLLFQEVEYVGLVLALTIILLIKSLCWNIETETLDLSNFDRAAAIYQQLRAPPTSRISDCSKSLGGKRERRSHATSSTMEDLMIQGEVMLDDNTLAERLPGANFDYAEEVKWALRKERRKQKGVQRPCSSSSSSLVGRDEKMKEALAALYGGIMPFAV